MQRLPNTASSLVSLRVPNVSLGVAVAEVAGVASLPLTRLDDETRNLGHALLDSSQVHGVASSMAP